MCDTVVDVQVTSPSQPASLKCDDVTESRLIVYGNWNCYGNSDINETFDVTV